MPPSPAFSRGAGALPSTVARRQDFPEGREVAESDGWTSVGPPRSLSPPPTTLNRACDMNSSFSTFNRFSVLEASPVEGAVPIKGDENCILDTEAPALSNKQKGTSDSSRQKCNSKEGTLKASSNSSSSSSSSSASSSNSSKKKARLLPPLPRLLWVGTMVIGYLAREI